MKKLFLLAITSLFLLSVHAQTATNFNCNDCAGVNHDLFTELDAGKVVVLCWVMPCSSCVIPSLTTYNVVSGFETSNPDKVVMYIMDDFANTNCTSLSGWVNNNGMTKATVFSNATINMNDYGTPGMPKVVVVADYDHAVYYNANNSVNGTELKDAINRAIDATLTGIPNPSGTHTSVEVFPNPSDNKCTVKVNVKDTAPVLITLYDQLGATVSAQTFSMPAAGENLIEMMTDNLREGIYFLNVKSSEINKTLKLTVAR